VIERLARAPQSRCPLYRKRESQHYVSGCKTSRNQPRCSLRLARRTTADRMEAHRKLDRHRDDPEPAERILALPHVNGQPKSSLCICALYTCIAQYPIWHGGATDGLDITSSQPRGAKDPAVLIDLNPATADMRLHGGREINHVRIFLSRHHLSGQIEIELSGFARLRLGVEDQCFDLSIDNESDFISANSQAVADVMAAGIGSNNLGKILRFNPDIDSLDWAPGAVFHNPFNRSAGSCAERTAVMRGHVRRFRASGHRGNDDACAHQ
jgi:hypothetical protein